MAGEIRALVTGAGRGIGAATAKRLASRGARVVLAARTKSELDGVAREIVEAHGASAAIAVRCDVSRTDEVQRLCARTLEVLGGLDVLVNNAGIALRAPIDAMTDAEWDRVLAVNLTSAFLCARAFLPSMRAQRRGRIVNVSSISGTLGTPRMTAYCASKWGLVGFTKALAEEVRADGVQAMAILPGSVDTAMLVGSGFPPAMSAGDVAGAIAYLALDAPDAMTGSAVEMFG